MTTSRMQLAGGNVRQQRDDDVGANNDSIRCSCTTINIVTSERDIVDYSDNVVRDAVEM